MFMLTELLGVRKSYILPVLAIIGVAGVGTYMLSVDHAATCREAVMAYGTGMPPKQPNACVKKAQIMLNGTYVARIHTFGAYAASHKYTTPSGGAAPFHGTIATDGEFGPQTLNRVAGVTARGTYQPN